LGTGFARRGLQPAEIIVKNLKFTTP